MCLLLLLPAKSNRHPYYVRFLALASKVLKLSLMCVSLRLSPKKTTSLEMCFFSCFLKKPHLGVSCVFGP
jgi:hypothetical protein